MIRKCARYFPPSYVRIRRNGIGRDKMIAPRLTCILDIRAFNVDIIDIIDIIDINLFMCIIIILFVVFNFF